MKLVSYADRPDLRARRHAELSGVPFPPYMHENEPGNRYWGRLHSDFGTLGDLPSGWEDGLTRG